MLILSLCHFDILYVSYNSRELQRLPSTARSLLGKREKLTGEKKEREESERKAEQ